MIHKPCHSWTVRAEKSREISTRMCSLTLLSGVEVYSILGALRPLPPWPSGLVAQSSAEPALVGLSGPDRPWCFVEQDILQMPEGLVSGSGTVNTAEDGRELEFVRLVRSR
jgi:hypothetical protein